MGSAATFIERESVIIRDKALITATVDNEVVMLSARAESYFGLDGVGSEIWEMIEQPRRVSDICTKLVGSYDIELPTCEKEVIEFLNELLGHGLIHLVAEEGQK